MTVFAAAFVVLQSTSITPLERLALVAVLAVVVIAVVRVITGRRERHRFNLNRGPGYSPLQLYRTGAQKPAGVTRPVRSWHEPAGESVTQDRKPAERAPAPPSAEAAAHRTSPTPAAPAARPSPTPAARTSSTPAPAQRPPTTPAASGPRPARPSTQPAGRPVAPTGAGREPASNLAEEVVDTGTVRFHRVAEGTLQLLPGRLEILAGADSREEIRFVKLAGRDPAFTFGRSPGEPHVHVQLQSPTVSRLHARMRCDAGTWLLSNLSRTNPVIVNGTALSNGSEQRLEDGDRVEMGEIVFQFRSR